MTIRYKFFAARDADGALYLYVRRPEKGMACWIPSSEDSDFFRIDDNLLPQVVWKHAAPRKVTISVKIL